MTDTRRERERQRHRSEILLVAVRLFSDKGFGNVSMQEIATAAEFAVGTLYNFFSSKEALFEEMIQDCAESIVQDLSAILDGPGDEVDRLRAFIRRQPALLEKHADLIKVYVSEIGTRGIKCRKDGPKGRVSAAVDAKIERLVESGVRKRLFRPVSPAITRIAIMSTLEALGLEMAGRSNTTEATSTFAKVEELFIQGLLLSEGQENA